MANDAVNESLLFSKDGVFGRSGELLVFTPLLVCCVGAIARSTDFPEFRDPELRL